MRKKVTLLLSCIIPFYCFAQHNLSGSRTTSVYRYIYRLTNEEALALYKSDMQKVGTKYLHTLVDSVTGEDDPPLPPGNYLWINARENTLHAELKTTGEIACNLVNNNRDLVIALHNKAGQLTGDADVFINHKRMAYDKTTQTFRVGKRSRTGLVKIYYREVLHLVPLEERRKWNNKNRLWHTISNAFPLRYVVWPVRRWLYYKRYNRDGYMRFFTDKTRYEQKFWGFMVFSKPTYKPGDTVRCKAFVTLLNGKPVSHPLLLRLTAPEFETDTILAEIIPYRPGAFEYSFVINDSLNHHLDEDYLLTLEALHSRENKITGKDKQSGKDVLAMKRPVLMRGKFRYEDYELATVSFRARTDKQEHNRQNQVAVYLKATDENDLAVMDGRVEILVTPSPNSRQEFTLPAVFLPDTLWYHTQPMETVGETKIMLPDSIFPAASFDYSIHCTFLSSNNEYKEQELS